MLTEEGELAVYGKVLPKQRPLPSETASNNSTPTGGIKSLLAAARTLSKRFTRSELVIAAWKVDRQRFGLAGYETEYPDANRVSALLSARQGPVVLGLLRRVAPNVYELVKNTHA